jgi:hypothetical protein
LRGLAVDGRILLKVIFVKYSLMLWTMLNDPRIGSSSTFL